MSKNSAIPDAWDDDWELQADRADAVAKTAKVEDEVKLTKAERLALHKQSQKKLWETAEEPETPYFLAARDNVPLKQEFKPALKVLSRKPTPNLVQKIDPLTGLAKMTLEDDDDEVKKDQRTPEELRLQAQRNLEEKQRLYNEARARILGTPSGSSTPRATTPPTEEGKAGRGRGKGRGTGRGETSRPQSQSGSKDLYDPNYTPKPGATIQKRNGEASRSGRSTPKDEDHIIRAPKGPDGNGRGFGNRGGRTS
ncbi:hypothetical protein QTJ16_004120 [Diplocarpon rosae]|uniref:SUZ-C domain-containing protein n=1 Tax=Diplocarpon rosae TaxID=946125 RepID=A0AAD9T267_9HELO|nr:hypothetical protein QTJ16_004120 [Diplocarpon rosae]